MTRPDSDDLVVDSIDGKRYVIRKRYDGMVGIVEHWVQATPDDPVDPSYPDNTRNRVVARMGPTDVYIATSLRGTDCRAIGQKVYISREAYEVLRTASDVADLGSSLAMNLSEAVAAAQSNTYTVDDGITNYIQGTS